MNAMMSSPSMRSQPPPATKKQRGGATPPPLSSRGMSDTAGRDFSVDADDAIARRRAELRRLQALRSNTATTNTTGDTTGGTDIRSASRSASRPIPSRPAVTNTEDLLAMARKNNQRTGPPPTLLASSGPPPTLSAAAGPPTSGPPTGKPPPSESLERVRHSDLFPTVPKTKSTAPSSSSRSTNPSARQQGPPPKNRPPIMTTAAGGRPPTTTTTAKNATVARRLDPSFANNAARAKSAPPSRPPPPPGAPPPRQSVETPASFKARPPIPPTSVGPPPKANKGPPTLSVPNSKLQPTPQQAPPKTPVSSSSANGISTSKAPVGKSSSSSSGPFINTPTAPSMVPNLVDEPSSGPVKTPGPSSGGKTTTPSEPPSTVRREMIRNFRDSAATPESMKAKADPSRNGVESSSSSSQPRNDKKQGESAAAVETSTNKKTTSMTSQRLEQELKSKDADHHAALKQIKELEQALKAAQEKAAAAAATAKTNNETPLVVSLPWQALLEKADSQGEQAAVEWARAELEKQSINGGVGGTSGTAPPFIASTQGGMAGFPTSPVAGMRSPEPRRRTRLVAPQPKQSFGADDDRYTNSSPSSTQRLPTATDTERKYHPYFIEASQCIPFEYQSEVATFVIRRPYGLDTEVALFESCSHVHPDKYGRRAHVSSAASIEVAAKIAADGSLLLLTGDAGVRYHIANEGQWREHANVDELDRPLGNISYIDEQANEQDYSLDEVFEGAVLARDQYCSSMFSTALGLRDRPVEKKEESSEPTPGVQQVKTVVVAPEKRPTSEMCVGTSDDPFPPTDIAIPDSSDNAKKTKKTEETPPEQAPSPNKATAKNNSGDSTDAFSWLLGSLFRLIFGTIWTILFEIPFKIITFTVVLTVSVSLVSLIWLYLEDDHGASAMGATTASLYYHRPGMGII